MRQRGTSVLTLSISFRTSEKSARGVVTMLLPSGTNTALTTKSVWPFRVASGLPSRSHSCAVFTEAVRTRPPSGRERRGDRIVVALRRAPFAPGVIFWQPPFRLAAQICTVLRHPPRRLPFQRATGGNLHTTTCWSFAACRPRH
jgi:hypothetical protein